jgi:uncharacterized protein YndB with AHSA1/START domain
MTNSDSPVAAAGKTELALVITRIFDAPREAVFKAWTDPAQIALWLGPRSIRAKGRQDGFAARRRLPHCFS